MVGGAWPYLVRGVICLVDSDNERDPRLLTRWCYLRVVRLLRGTTGASQGKWGATTGQ